MTDRRKKPHIGAQAATMPKKTEKVATYVVASQPPNGDQLQRRLLVPVSVSGLYIATF